ncbi:hypothetical protein [uncultured Dokdonia sp.]|uniref:hypothetical protein n=1 Tax=uncultured Dokdonia sp. TaxID=575653 RepID=UPI002635780F|nr:hypothetical protein [uncultured Dokdonia sp.]
MKRFILLCCGLLLSLSTITAQTDTYSVNNQSYELKTDVEGPMTLLWNIIDQEYRYFAKKGTTITELTNTKDGKKYQEEYKKQLQELTGNVSLNTDKVKLTLASLRRFFNTYNKEVDPSYKENSFLTNMEYRLGAFAGITNSVFVDNPNNTSNTQFGIDFELYDATALPSHAIVFQYKQTLSSDEFDYSAAQFSINHRFKFIKKPTFQIYLNTKLVTFTTAKRSQEIDDDTIGLIAVGDSSGSSLQGPVIFGLGADIKIGKGYLSLNYNDAYSFILDDNGEFPVDLTIGYRFVL